MEFRARGARCCYRAIGRCARAEIFDISSANNGAWLPLFTHNAAASFKYEMNAVAIDEDQTCAVILRISGIIGIAISRVFSLLVF